jgi:hypothetical protein
MTKKVNFIEDKSWELEMPDNSSLHRIDVFVGKVHIDYFFVATKYLKYFKEEKP